MRSTSLACAAVLLSATLLSGCASKLIAAASSEDREFLRVQLQDESGLAKRVALNKAISAGNTIAVKNLLEAGVVIHQACSPFVPAMADIIAKGQSEMALLLISAGMEPSCPSNSEPGIIESAALNNESLVKALLDAGVDVNTTSSRSETALHWAAFKGSPSLVELLIQNGAFIDAPGTATPLAVAIRNKRWDNAKVLSHHRATWIAYDDLSKAPILTCLSIASPLTCAELVSNELGLLRGSANNLDHLRFMSNQGIASASVILGFMHQFGTDGFSRSDTTATEFYSAAARSGAGNASVLAATLMNDAGDPLGARQFAEFYAARGFPMPIAWLQDRGHPVPALIPIEPAASVPTVAAASNPDAGVLLGAFLGILGNAYGTYSAARTDSLNNLAANAAAQRNAAALAATRASAPATYNQAPLTFKQHGAQAIANPAWKCAGYAGPGGPCYDGPGGPAYSGPGGPAYAGPGGPAYAGPGGPRYDGPGGAEYAGPGGPAYAGPGGPRYDGAGGPAYSGAGGPCYAGPGGPCYSGPGGTGVGCSSACR